MQISSPWVSFLLRGRLLRISVGLQKRSRAAGGWVVLNSLSIPYFAIEWSSWNCYGRNTGRYRDLGRDTGRTFVEGLAKALWCFIIAMVLIVLITIMAPRFEILRHRGGGCLGLTCFVQVNSLGFFSLPSMGSSFKLSFLSLSKQSASYLPIFIVKVNIPPFTNILFHQSNVLRNIS
jgi:hypothetical protein